MRAILLLVKLSYKLETGGDMQLNKLDKALLLDIATEKSQGGHFYRFEHLLVVFGRWSRNGIYPRGLELYSVTNRVRKAIFVDPASVFLLIDSLLCRYKLDNTFKAKYLAFDLYFLTSPKSENTRAAKTKTLKALLNSAPASFLKDYVRAYQALTELIRLDLLERLKAD